MRRLFRRAISALFAVSSVATVIGCGSQDAAVGSAALIAEPPEILPTFVAHVDSHDHESPHGGRIIELGRNHAFHAELLIDTQSGSITIYVLDRDLKELAIDVANITLIVANRNQPQAMLLACTNQTNGRASQFSLQNAELAQSLDDAKATGKLHITIEGRPYIGYISARENTGHAHQHVH